MLSLLFALATVPVAFWGAGLVFGRRAAWFAAVLAALNPYITQYAQETRMYALVVLLGMLATALFLRAYTGDERPARRWPVLFGLALAAALYTHNWALFFGAAMFLAWLVLLWLAPAAERRARLRDGALGFGLTALLYLPWVPTLLFQAAHTGAPWSRRPGFEDLTRTCRTGCSATRPGSCSLVAAGGGAVALVRAGRGRRLTAEGRAVRRGRDRRRRDRAARLRRPRRSRPRGSMPLPRGRRPAVPAARRRRPRRVARPRAPRPRRRRDPVGLRRAADEQEQRAPGGGGDLAQPPARATSWSPRSPSRCRCSRTTCPTGCATRR